MVVYYHAKVDLFIIKTPKSLYKQDESPRYNARDIAVVRGKIEKATVLLGSATPSLESYYNCERGRYKLVEMTQRIDNSRLPTIELVDMAQESTKTGQAQLFSTRLTEKIMDRLYKGEQVILFLNRRGYATQMINYLSNADELREEFELHGILVQIDGDVELSTWEVCKCPRTLTGHT